MAAERPIFTDLKIWVSQKVPMRSHFINQIKDNGGSVEGLEKKADILIADHARKEQIPGTYSYTFIEHSVRNGTLANLEDHRIGPTAGTPRMVGSIAQPTKGTRTKYTAAEDRILWEWVDTHPQKGGGTDGNEIYKQLEAKHPQHTWQSWRDRFIKRLKGRPPPSTILEHGPPTPPLEPSVIASHPEQPRRSPQKNHATREFSEADAAALLGVADSIESIPPEKLEEAWESFAETDRSEKGGAGHSPRKWRRYWEEVVRPQLRSANAEQVSASAQPQDALEEDESASSTSEHVAYIDARERLGQRSSPVDKLRKSPTRLAQSAHKHSSSVSTPALFYEAPEGKDTGGHSDIAISPRIDPQGEAPPRLKRKRQNAPDTPTRETASANRVAEYHSTEGAARQEIPSTPERSPHKRKRRSSSPLFLQDDDDDVEIKEEKEASDQTDPSERYESGLESEPFARGLLQSMAQMERQKVGTQDIFRDRSPTLDLGVALPEGGWDFEQERAPSPEIKTDPELGIGGLDYDAGGEGSDLNPEGVDLDEYLDDDEHEQIRSTIPETQKVYREATPMPDLDVVEPEGGFESFVAPASPTQVHASQEEGDEKSSNSDYDAQLGVFVENAVAKGFPEEVSLAVLISTSLDTELAKRALEHMGRGKRKSRGDDEWELPDDWEGVWTEADDEAITAVDGRVIERLIRKHGTKSYDVRREFLSEIKGK